MNAPLIRIERVGLDARNQATAEWIRVDHHDKFRHSPNDPLALCFQGTPGASRRLPKRAIAGGAVANPLKAGNAAMQPCAYRSKLRYTHCNRLRCPPHNGGV